MFDRLGRPTQILALVALGLAVGCGTGGGNGDEGCPPATTGSLLASVDITLPCAPDALVTWTADLDVLDLNNVRVRLHVPATGRCCPEVAVLFGTAIGPGIYEVEDVLNVVVCALQDQYGYEIIGVTDAQLWTAGGGFTLSGDFSVVYGGASCLGTVEITAIPPL